MDVTVWECVRQNREGDHLRVAKPEGPPHPPPSWARLKQRSGSARLSWATHIPHYSKWNAEPIKPHGRESGPLAGLFSELGEI